MNTHERDFIRITDTKPLVLSVSALSDFLWDDFVRDTKPSVKYLIDRYNIRQLSRFGKELFEYLYQSGNVNWLVDPTLVTDYLHEKAMGGSPTQPQGYKPENALWVGLFASICEAPAWPMLVDHCAGDQFKSGNNALCILEKLSEVIETSSEACTALQRLSQDSEKLEDLRQQFIAAKERGDNEKAAELREQGKQLGKQIEQQTEATREQLQAEASEVLDKAQEQAEKIEDAVSQLAGSESGHGQHSKDLIAKRDLAKELARNPKLMQLANRLGGLRRAWSDRKRAKRTENTYSDIVGAKFSDAIHQAFPSELALAGSDKGRALFALKYAQKTLLTKDYEAHTKDVAHGPVVMYVDISGSMNGSQELWSKALAYVVAEECLKQKRELQIHLFDTLIVNSLQLDRTRTDNENLLEFVLTWATRGGTSFNAVLNHAVRPGQIDPKADVLMITDGQAEITDTLIKRLTTLKNSQGLNWYTFCIGTNYGSLEQFSDSIYTVDTTKDAKTAAIFQTIL